MERSLDPSEVTRVRLGTLGIVCLDLWTLRLVLQYVPSRMSLCPDSALSTKVCCLSLCPACNKLFVSETQGD